MKTMGKRILTIILCLCLMIPLMAVCVSADDATSGSCGENITWKFKDSTLTISGSGDMTEFEFQRDVPWAHLKEDTKKIIVEDGVTSISKYSFGSFKAATEIIIPEGVTQIGHGAFFWCESITEIVLPNTLTSIESALLSLCSSLTSITIPRDVASINGTAFDGCYALNQINVAEGNENFTLVDGVLFNKDKTEIVLYPFAREGGYIIPEGVTSIAERAFVSAGKLTEITAPQSLKFIGAYAFRYCYELLSVTFNGENIELEQICAFEHAKKLKAIYVPEGCVDAYKAVFKNQVVGNFVEEETLHLIKKIGDTSETSEPEELQQPQSSEPANLIAPSSSYSERPATEQTEGTTPIVPIIIVVLVVAVIAGVAVILLKKKK